MSYKNFPIGKTRKDRKFPARDLRKDEINKLKQYVRNSRLVEIKENELIKR